MALAQVMIITTTPLLFFLTIQLELLQYFIIMIQRSILFDLLSRSWMLQCQLCHLQMILPIHLYLPFQSAKLKTQDYPIIPKPLQLLPTFSVLLLHQGH